MLDAISWEEVGSYKLPNEKKTWMCSHAQLPTGIILSNNIIRVFFATRSAQQYSHVGFVDLLFNKNGEKFEVVSTSVDPVLRPGNIGEFDEHGVYPSSIVKNKEIYYMYYIGWIKGFENPQFYASIGLATSKDGETFKKISNIPIISRNQYDPYLVTSPNVLIENKVWKMYYVSGIKWERLDNGKLRSLYNIRSAFSKNHIDWKIKGDVAIDLGNRETNIARPAVIKLSDKIYRMWFCYVDEKIGHYKIGFATSNDGKSWNRNDKVALKGLNKKIISNVTAYPSILKFKDRIYMFFNKNDFGREGFEIIRTKYKVS